MKPGYLTVHDYLGTGTRGVMHSVTVLLPFTDWRTQLNKDGCLWKKRLCCLTKTAKLI